jgi:demethylmacrocin O-methyltransferase
MILHNPIKNFLKNQLSPQQILMARNIYAKLYSNNLSKLADIYGSDKFGSHYYTRHYETYFKPLRYKKLNILEIGIGGDQNPERGGASLRMWREYFPNSKIYGIDIFNKTIHDEKRIKTFQGSQVDLEFLEKTINEIGNIDIIIDDGSHINKHVITSFNFLYPKLDDNGIYVIEDTQTSYWKSYGGNNQDFNSSETIMGFFKSLVDGLNKNVERSPYP